MALETQHKTDHNVPLVQEAKELLEIWSAENKQDDPLTNKWIKRILEDIKDQKQGAWIFDPPPEFSRDLRQSVPVFHRTFVAWIMGLSGTTPIQFVRGALAWLGQQETAFDVYGWLDYKQQTAFVVDVSSGVSTAEQNKREMDAYACAYAKRDKHKRYFDFLLLLWRWARHSTESRHQFGVELQVALAWALIRSFAKHCEIENAISMMKITIAAQLPIVLVQDAVGFLMLDLHQLPQRKISDVPAFFSAWTENMGWYFVGVRLRLGWSRVSDSWTACLDSTALFSQSQRARAVQIQLLREHIHDVIEGFRAATFSTSQVQRGLTDSEARILALDEKEYLHVVHTRDHLDLQSQLPADSDRLFGRILCHVILCPWTGYQSTMYRTNQLPPAFCMTLQHAIEVFDSFSAAEKQNCRQRTWRWPKHLLPWLPAHFFSHAMIHPRFTIKREIAISQEMLKIQSTWEPERNAQRPDTMEILPWAIQLINYEKQINECHIDHYWLRKEGVSGWSPVYCVQQRLQGCTNPHTNNITNLFAHRSRDIGLLAAQSLEVYVSTKRVHDVLIKTCDKAWLWRRLGSHLRNFVRVFASEEAKAIANEHHLASFIINAHIERYPRLLFTSGAASLAPRKTPEYWVSRYERQEMAQFGYEEMLGWLDMSSRFHPKGRHANPAQDALFFFTKESCDAFVGARAYMLHYILMNNRSLLDVVEDYIL